MTKTMGEECRLTLGHIAQSVVWS